MDPTYLICLPFAGAGASFFKEWQQHAPEGLHIVPVQLPGREERFIDEPHTDAARAAEDACDQVLGQVDGAGRVALFGHSLGAVLAYELAHRLCGMDGVTVDRLIVSGSPGPWNGRESRASDLDDEGFLAQVRLFAGYSHPALENPEMRELLLPMLRADVEMHENYRPASEKPLPVPITAVRGCDDELVDSAQLGQWAKATSAGLTTGELVGGHMYLTDKAPDLLRLIAAELRTGTGR
ncbi:thioesterase II family protein [Streptomyces sp. NPDC048527]|uniref:thioesterase II family protein n=1 Tax=Streptomyces sp. NPDC048527 TaxID=3365568 RepID=UPI0037157E01